jgi:tetratricopeptide (TPR) repeat protein
VLISRSASGRSEPAWAEPFQQAVSQLRSGDVSGAMQRFDLIWKDSPNDAQLATWIGASLDSTSHHTEATAWYLRSLTIRPDFEPALNDLALNYATLGEFSKAEPLLKQALRINPSNVHAAYNLGLLALRLRDYKEAADTFERVRMSGGLSISPEQLTLAEATARFHLREYGRAVKLLESTGNNRDYGWLMLLGSAQALSGDLPGSIKTLQNASKLRPDDPQVYYRLALVFMLGRLDVEAQNVLEAGLKQIPNAPLLLFGKAVSSDTQGKLNDAVAFARQSLAANTQQPEAWALLGRVYAELGQTEEALKAYDRAVALGGDAQAGVDRVQLLIRMERYPEAEAELGRLAKHYPENAGVDLGFGKLYREERRFDLAEKYVRQAIQLDPDNADAHFALAEVLRLTHRMDEARHELAIFKEQKPAGNATRLLELAANSPGEAGMR